jgi:hypothetical protein
MVDMSPKAVTERLRLMGELCEHLGYKLSELEKLASSEYLVQEDTNPGVEDEEESEPER